MTSELRPAAWMYRRMTTAEGDRVEFTRTPWAYVLTGYTETPLYTREAVRAEQAAELAKFKALAETLAGALENALRCTPQAKHGAIFYDCGDPWEILTKALRKYKEARDGKC